jgi:hypothetical protein
MITVILNGYNRIEYMQEQIDSINNQTIKCDDIMLWYNKGESEQLIFNNNIKTAFCNYNFKFHGRFAFALLAKSEYIALFDDDCIPGSKWFENCLNVMKESEGILGTTGVILNSINYEDSYKIGYNSILNDNIEEVDLVGHAWFIKRDWLKYMWYEYPISWENGEDIQFSYLCQKYGGIKTFVPPHKKDDIESWGNIKSHYSADEFASYKKQNHATLRDFIVGKAIENGWKTVKMRKNI